MIYSKKTSISIDYELWKKFKLHCVNKNTTVSKEIRRFIQRELGR